MKILKAIWFVFESICFAVGLFVLINLLTTFINDSSININKNGEQVFCFSVNRNVCLNTLSEETKHEQN